MKEIKIDKGIPIPKNNNNLNRNTFRNMDIGDSIFFTDEVSYSRAMGKAASCKTRYPNEFNYTSSKIQGEGWRIWRVEVVTKDNK